MLVRTLKYGDFTQQLKKFVEIVFKKLISYINGVRGLRIIKTNLEHLIFKNI